MKVLVVGGGGREHALITKILENPGVSAVYAMPGNGGIARIARCLPGGGARNSAADIEAVLGYVKTYGIDFVVVSPDDPLVAGMASAVRAAGVRAFGPDAGAAAIEGSKVFAKNLMKKYDIPTARYETFDNGADAMSYIRKLNHFPAVIKADGLALGKGVFIAADYAEAEDAVKKIMIDKLFGSSGGSVVVEEYLEGPEVTVLAFTDSKTIAPMVSSMDHKRAFDGDAGPNTGGMGVIAPNPHYTEETAAFCMERIFRPTIRAMNKEGRPFKGCLYFGLMLTSSGPKVIEYNCRFGDPEAQATLPLLETDLLSIMQAVEEERLADIEIRFKRAASCCLVLASGGYPGTYSAGFRITEPAAPSPDTSYFYAGVEQKEDGLYTSGGRVLGITALAENLDRAVKKAYREAEKVSFEGMYYRRDIGGKALAPVID
ncbi:MAG: phosphoribosylamine--glycine ligase [Treponema sp.]|jgi:phosphoribosylamine--glycine ligase|nr:phosphoribosylamine--glycine ligase [Treponema sp.]